MALLIVTPNKYHMDTLRRWSNMIGATSLPLEVDLTSKKFLKMADFGYSHSDGINVRKLREYFGVNSLSIRYKKDGQRYVSISPKHPVTPRISDAMKAGWLLREPSLKVTNFQSSKASSSKKLKRPSPNPSSSSFPDKKLKPDPPKSDTNIK